MKQMKDVLNGFGAIMLYFLFEAAIIAAVISTAWLFTLKNKIGINLNFFDWYFMIFTFKLIRFDIFKFIDLNKLPQKQKKENKNEI